MSGSRDASTQLRSFTMHADSECAGPAVSVSISSEPDCSDDDRWNESMCYTDAFTDFHIKTTCATTTRSELLQSTFQGRRFVAYDTNTLQNCDARIDYTVGYLASGECVPTYGHGGGVATLTDGGLMTLETMFDDIYTCSGDSYTFVLDSDDSACVYFDTKAYSFYPQPAAASAPATEDDDAGVVISVFEDRICYEHVSVYMAAHPNCSAAMSASGLNRSSCIASYASTREIYYAIECMDNWSNRTARKQVLSSAFSRDYLAFDTLAGSCDDNSVNATYAFLADGRCHDAFNLENVRASLWMFSPAEISENGRSNYDCEGEPVVEIATSDMKREACVTSVGRGPRVYYTTSDTGMMWESGSESGGGGASNPTSGGGESASSTGGGLASDSSSSSTGKAPAKSSGLWDDPVIVGSRVPREKVEFGDMLSCGGFGVVYSGTFSGRRVAIKMLLPETRRDLPHVDAFLAEVKLMASLDHPCIVQFIGVAWDSLFDLCTLSELMDGGDLRTLLSSFQASGHPTGFDADKLRIAFDVAQALTYLHSLRPVVIHRDLKSRNVLLDSGSRGAKLTDFGVARERAERTMTAGIGTSLWMAPEVMLGERYDEKADVFSYGVLLSELGTHALPYAHAGLSHTLVLQLVASGTLSVLFTAQPADEQTARAVALGRACVVADPTQRPTAAEVCYRVSTILRSAS